MSNFFRFPRLPIELRIIIWELSLEARVVGVKRVEDDSQTEAEDLGFCTSEPTPTALRVCKESREAVLSQYPICFGSVWYKSDIRFNFKLDTLYMDFNFYDHLPFFVSVIDSQALQGLRYLALDIYGLEYEPIGESHLGPGFISALQKTIASMKGLRQLLAVYETEWWFHERDFQWVEQWGFQRGSDRVILYSGLLPPAIQKLAGDLSSLGNFVQFDLPTEVPSYLLSCKVPTTKAILAWKTGLTLKHKSLDELVALRDQETD